MTILAQLEKYQIKAVDFAMERQAAALFCEQGTGKTWITAGIVETMAHSNVSMLLVVPLANIETSWARLLATMDVNVYRDWDSFKARTLDRASVLLLHYEALNPVIKKIRKFPWALIVYDESQRLKGRGSKQSRTSARFVRHPGQRRVILSGTPVEQAPQDLWAQFRFIDPSVLGSWSTFEGTFLRATGFMGYKLEFKRPLLKAFLRRVEPFMHRVLKDDVLDIPPVDFKRVVVEMLGRQRTTYEELDHGVVRLREGIVTCDLEITKLIRRQQVTSGFIRLDPTERQRQACAGTKKKPKGTVVFLGSAKARRLARLVKREKPPFIVFCKYTQEIPQIEATLAGLRVGVIRGKLKRQRTATVDAFQRGELDALVCQIRAGGVGLDLFRARTAIFFSSTFSWIDFDQAIARLHRRGQTRVVRAYLLQAADTVDSDIWSALLLKKSVTRAVLDRRKTHTRK